MRLKLIILGGLLACSSNPAASQAAPKTSSLTGYTETIPGTLVTFDMVPVPGDHPFWIGRTEVTWDEYDVFAYRLDQPGGEAGVDARARPSKPYGAPDYGWGHQGFPAISVAAPAAMEYAAWLSEKTGKKYRLATEAEWTRAAELGLTRSLRTTPIDSLAWHGGNSSRRAHPVRSKRPDALGLYDMAGNAAEWVLGADGRPLTRGGSWADSAAAVGPAASARPNARWQERDPQFPKSRWWLSDGPFVGFRIVREP